MYLSEIQIKNFRKFGDTGLFLKLNKRFNLLVGENDSGKTAIIDAIKLVLSTQGFDYFRVDYDDFHFPPTASSEDERATNLEITCIFRGFSIEEAKHFLEWMHIEKDEDNQKHFVLKVLLSAKRKGKEIFTDIKAGGIEEGKYLSSEARNLLRITYLKPLRDAENELIPRRNSRLSQILMSHEAFENETGHIIVEAVKEANEKIKKYFHGKDLEDRDLPDQLGKGLLNDINQYLGEFSSVRRTLSSGFSISELKLKNILERLSLHLEDKKPGLGSHNVLFIAAELLLLQRKEYEGLKMALIEEVEAHLHVQSQLRLIEYLEEEADKSDMQLILTTHSTAIASKIKLEHLFICQGDRVFPMNADETELSKGDYLFLERFLDSTKADLSFAQGVIMVEGDAENLLIPTIAKIIGYPLSKYGVTVLNVGSTAFLRYSKIFQRKNPQLGIFDIPVACITDLDIKPDFAKEYEKNSITYSDRIATQEIGGIISNKKEHIEGQTVKAFVSPLWTLEHDIATSSLQRELLRAVLYAKKIQNSDRYALTDEKRKEVEEEIGLLIADWDYYNFYSHERKAFEIYYNIVLKKGNEVSKAIIAQCLAMILSERENQDLLKKQILEDNKLQYLVEAIKYATGQV